MPRLFVDRSKLEIGELQPAPHDQRHLLEVVFLEDGAVSFFPSSDDPAAFDEALRQLSWFLIEHPETRSKIAYGIGGGR